MNKTLMVLAFLGLVTATAHAETTHTQQGHQHRNNAYEQAAVKANTEKQQSSASPVSTKRLPGRDCKLYEGSTRQHSFPQYEIGNTNRPECPSA